jgi:hypothetical protein
MEACLFLSAIPTNRMPAFSAHIVVYKHLQVNNSRRKEHWTGYLQDASSRAVEWCDGNILHYGPDTEDSNPALYTDDCLDYDMRAAALIVQAIRLLRKNPTARLAIDDSPAKQATVAAIKDIKRYYRNPAANPKPDWLDWLEAKLDQPKEVVGKKCRKCGVDGCTG